MQPKTFRVIIPSTLRVGEEFRIKVKAVGGVRDAPWGAYPEGSDDPMLGRYNLSPRGLRMKDDVPLGWRGVLEVEGTCGLVGPDHVHLGSESGNFNPATGEWLAKLPRPVGAFEGFKFTEPGCGRVTLRNPGTGAVGVSNPAEVVEEGPEFRLYWGDLHCQTFFSDGLRCPEELYEFAKEEGMLDIFGLADHDYGLSQLQWRYFVEVTNSFYRPGEFVTIVGYEWTSDRYGHRNLHFPGDWGQLLKCTEKEGHTLERIREHARRNGALLVPHHTANFKMGCSWDQGWDPECERLVEIYSVWGNSERPSSEGNTRPIRVSGGEREGQHVLDALDRGYRFGFIGGGDTHDGRPGDELHTLQEREDYKLLWRQGIMGVWARELTREGVWEALWARRVYASSNCRILLWVTVCDAPMGSELRCSGPRRMAVRALGEGPISLLEVVRNRRTIAELRPHQETVSWSVEDTFAGPAYYYVRVTQEDGEMAWSSPVWVEPR